MHTWSENPFDGPAWAGGGPAPRLADGVLCCLLPFSEPVGTQPIPKQRAFHFQTLSRALAKGLFFCRAQTWRWELSGQLPSSQTGKRERPLAAQPPAAQPPAAQPSAALRRRPWGAPRALHRGYGVCVARGPRGGPGGAAAGPRSSRAACCGSDGPVDAVRVTGRRGLKAGEGRGRRAREA